jgi:UDP-N-acetylglucosamine--N-acetylmuramyl-(pentapeptide) pyrophosphoryl-undecaprenol N-acetylglucosamine transferase
LPLIIVEPNSYPGLVNRVLARAAKKVVLSFPGTDRRGFFAAGTRVQTGPLVRADIGSGDREKALREFGLEAGRYTVLVTGGSGGAHAVNMAMKDAARRIAGIPGIQVLHQTGEKDQQEVSSAYGEAGVKAAVLPYLHDMAGAYAAADLVISRSGATTVAELAVCGKHAVLIPYPYAADNHQEHNARTLALAGAAEVIIQRDLNAERLAEAIKRRAEERKEPPLRMETTAAREIVRICRSYVRKD